MTKARSAIIEILAAARAPLSAASIHESLDFTCDTVTVYRTLHYLEAHGLADSFILHCSDHGTERYYTARAECDGESLSHRHWFHCEKCHRFIDLGACTLENLVRTYENEYGIDVRSHTLYLTGLCPTCRH